MYINASDENSVDTVRNKVRWVPHSTMGFKDYKIIILDECDYITPNNKQFRNLMETFSKHCRFI